MEVDAIRSLLGGSFQGEGRGGYPNISNFEYFETIDLVLSPKGFLAYRSTTKSKIDGSPMHTECGYLRVISQEGVELIIAQPTGLAEVATGAIFVDGGEVTLRLEAVPTVSPSAKAVGRTVRELRFGESTLNYNFHMETDKVEMTWHLSAELRRIGGDR